MNFVYGANIIDFLSSPLLSASELKKQKRHAEKEAALLVHIQKHADCVLNWPQKIPEIIKLNSAHNYCIGSQWKMPLICAVCAQQTEGVNVQKIEVSPDMYDRLHLDLLLAEQNYSIENCNLECCSTQYCYGVDILHNHMLSTEGIVVDKINVPMIQICDICEKDLQINKLPKFALANNLYRGVLPKEFEDLTWVEEMICSIYRNTAHVTRLFQSTDPKQPKVFHGNTCAHEMNIVSTASVLPRTPADINDMLSVVFVGPGKFSPDMLGSQYRIRKKKVWHFLMWLNK